MYDEFVKRLRDAAKMSEALAVLLPHSEGSPTAKLYNKAANAIEELSLMADSYKQSMEKWADEAANAQPRWIPVTERLPEKNGPYLCCWKASADEKKYIARTMVWRVDTGWMNVWDEPMSKYITHWMPLPELPKEE